MMGVALSTAKSSSSSTTPTSCPTRFPALALRLEGQPYIKPQQYQMVVSRFQQPQAYAATYAKHRFRRDVCKDHGSYRYGLLVTYPACKLR